MIERADLLTDIHVIDPLWIPMRDGARLAARIVLPKQALHTPVPAVLEYLPYRRGDGTAKRDAIRHPYLAGHGIAAVRVDMRGSGDSDGILYDEYLYQEQLDACDVIAWIAAQPWCTGSVGMFGISWGGFNALQVAAMNPPALKAIITVCSTDDRYADDVHYMGGCMLAVDMLPWASVMLAYNARPPDPMMVGDQWREMWQTRLEETPPFIETWLAHQRRDAYWRHGSVCEDFSNIQCPVYVVGGWADGYTNAVFRLLEGLAVPRKGLIGAWAHTYPDAGLPGPAVGFQDEAVKWWQHWLQDIPNDVMQGPMLTSYIQAWIEPSSWYAWRPGRWVANDVPTAATAQVWHICAHGLDSTPHPNDAETRTIGTTLRHGADAGMWCSYAQPGDYAPDQRGEDGRGLAFDTPVVTTAYDVLGFPDVTLRLSASHVLAQVVVRLCAVSPDGASLLVSRGVLNLTHRHGHDVVADTAVTTVETVTVRLNAVGYRIEPGWRWRLVIAPAYWPHVWPSPTLVTLQIALNGSSLSLPVRQPQLDDATAADRFGPVQATPITDVRVVRPHERQRYERFDQVTGEWQLHDEQDAGVLEIRDGLHYAHRSADRYMIVEGDPLSARSVCEHTIVIERGDWQTRVETSSELTCDATHFHVTNRVQAWLGDDVVFETQRVQSMLRDGL